MSHKKNSFKIYLKNSSDGEIELFDLSVVSFKLPSQQLAVFHGLSQYFHGTSLANEENKKYKPQVIITT
jgi:hypothetical protein